MPLDYTKCNVLIVARQEKTSKKNPYPFYLKIKSKDLTRQDSQGPAMNQLCLTRGLVKNMFQRSKLLIVVHLQYNDNQGCGVRGKISDSGFSKISDSLT